MKKITEWITNRLATLAYYLFIIGLMFYSLFAAMRESLEQDAEKEMEANEASPFYPHQML